jgi:hypothetical protein
MHGDIERAIEALSMSPVERVNGAAYYSDEQVEAIAEHLRTSGTNR